MLIWDKDEGKKKKNFVLPMSTFDFQVMHTFSLG